MRHAPLQNRIGRAGIASAKRGSSPVQPESSNLEFGVMAGMAFGFKDGLPIASEAGRGVQAVFPHPKTQYPFH